MTRRQQHAVPGGGSALKPPPREQPPPAPDRPPVTEEESVTGAPERGTAEELPPPPPVTRRHPREQLNTKIRVDMRQRLNAFVTRHDSTLQGVLEAALDEYMARRGWSWEDYQRSNRRR